MAKYHSVLRYNVSLTDYIGYILEDMSIDQNYTFITSN